MPRHVVQSSNITLGQDMRHSLNRTARHIHMYVETANGET